MGIPIPEDVTNIQTITLDERVYDLGFKVVTGDLESLGLRKNPFIIKYPINEWYALPPDRVERGKNDFGGIWVARTLGGARSLRDYMQEKYAKETRIFKATLGEILYHNGYRIKTDRIKMFEEIF
jgi:hypothetical protein